MAALWDSAFCIGGCPQLETNLLRLACLHATATPWKQLTFLNHLLMHRYVVVLFPYWILHSNPISSPSSSIVHHCRIPNPFSRAVCCISYLTNSHTSRKFKPSEPVQECPKRRQLLPLCAAQLSRWPTVVNQRALHRRIQVVKDSYHPNSSSMSTNRQKIHQSTTFMTWNGDR